MDTRLHRPLQRLLFAPVLIEDGLNQLVFYRSIIHLEFPLAQHFLLHMKINCYLFK